MSIIQFKPILILSAVLLAFVPATAHTQESCAQPWTSNGVEGRRSLSTAPWGWTKSSEQVLAGRHSQRFEVRAGDCAGDEKGWHDCKMDRERSEILVEKPRMYSGQRYFVAWNLYIPEDFVSSDRVKTTLGQIHSLGGPRGTAAGLPSKPPLLQFDVYKGKYQMCWHKLSGDPLNIRDRCEWHTLAALDDLRGKWTEVVIEVDLDPREGYARVWVNGQQRVDIPEPVATYRPQHFYLKYGIYRSFVSRQAAPMPTQIVYFDEVRIGHKFNQVSRLNCTLKPLD